MWKFISFVSGLFMTTLCWANDPIEDLVSKLQSTDAPEARLAILVNMEEDLPNSARFISYSMEALELARRLNNRPYEAKIQMLVADGKMEEGLLDEAIAYYESAKSYYLSVDSALEVASIDLELGNIFYQQNKLSDALDRLFNSVRLFERLDLSKREADVRLKIGELLNQQKSYKDAKRYYKEAIAYFEKEALEYTSELIHAYNQLGITLDNLNKNSEAQKYFEKAKALAQKSGNEEGELSYLTNIGWSNYLAGNFENAISICKEGLEASEKKGDKVMIEQNCRCIGASYFKLNLMDEAEGYLKRAFELGEVLEAPSEIAESAILLSQFYEKEGDFKFALQYFKTYKSQVDKIQSAANEEELLEIKHAFDAEQLQKDKKILEVEQEKQAATIASQNMRYLLIISLFVLAILGAVIFGQKLYKKASQSDKYKFKVRDQTHELKEGNKRLKELNNELQQFAYLASHDLKEPIRNILSYSSLATTKLKVYQDKKLNQILEAILMNTRQMYEMVNNVFEYTSISDGKVPIRKVDTSAVVKDVSRSMEQIIKAKNAIIEFDHLPSLHTNRSYLQLIFKNLIENGIKYNESARPVVRIEYYRKNTFHEFRVVDNGIGIPAEYHDYIFQMFKRLHNKEKYHGSGLGLAICHKAISKLGGDITVHSSSNAGSTFYFWLPLEEQEENMEMEDSYKPEKLLV